MARGTSPPARDFVASLPDYPLPDNPSLVCQTDELSDWLTFLWAMSEFVSIVGLIRCLVPEFFVLLFFGFAMLPGVAAIGIGMLVVAAATVAWLVDEHEWRMQQMR
jgi:hypothetical protein